MRNRIVFELRMGNVLIKWPRFERVLVEVRCKVQAENEIFATEDEANCPLFGDDVRQWR